MLSDSLQTDSKWIRVGKNQHRQEQQPQGISSKSLWEGSDAVVRQVPRILHGSYSGKQKYFTDNYFELRLNMFLWL